MKCPECCENFAVRCMLHGLIVNIQLNSMCIFVCSENIAICLEQISKRQAGIFNSIRDSEQVAESNYLKISNSVSDWDKMRASKVFILPGFITIWIAKTGDLFFFFWMALLEEYLLIMKK